MFCKSRAKLNPNRTSYSVAIWFVRFGVFTGSSSVRIPSLPETFPSPLAEWILLLSPPWNLFAWWSCAVSDHSSLVIRAGRTTASGTRCCALTPRKTTSHFGVDDPTLTHFGDQTKCQNCRPAVPVRLHFRAFDSCLMLDYMCALWIFVLLLLLLLLLFAKEVG